MTDTVKNKKNMENTEMAKKVLENKEGNKAKNKTENKAENNSKARVIYVLLHNIRSSHNVGSIFRSSDAFGVVHIAITGYTPSPLDRFGKVNDTLAKVALGAESTVSWKKYSGPASALREFKKAFPAGKVVALEQSSEAVLLGSSEMVALLGGPNVPVFLILGNEVEGVSSALLRKADLIVEIPQAESGTKESLNVSVAGGVAIYELIK